MPLLSGIVTTLWEEWMRPWTTSCRNVLSTVALAIGLFCGSALAQEMPSIKARSVIEIFDRQLAVPSCQTCRDIRIGIGGCPSPMTYVNVGWILDDPARFRNATACANRVEVFDQITPRRINILSGLDPDGDALNLDALLITIYRTPSKVSDCFSYRGQIAVPRCPHLQDLYIATTQVDTAGFVSDTDVPGTVRGTTLYVDHEPAPRSATNVPYYIFCYNWTPTCENSSNAVSKPGYLISPDIGIGFKFDPKTYPESKWASLLSRIQSLVELIVIK